MDMEMTTAKMMMKITKIQMTWTLKCQIQWMTLKVIERRVEKANHTQIKNQGNI